MKRALLLALALALPGCAEAIRISVAAGRVVCGALGCPCTSATSGGARTVVAFDVLPNGTVQPVYGEASR